MLGLVIFLHVLISIMLITVILMQSGRGGGLTEGLAAGAESIFGSKTNVFMVRTTTVLAIIFLITTLSLAFLSTRKNKSLMERMIPQKATTSAVLPVPTPASQPALPGPAKEEPKRQDIAPTTTSPATK
jgi:preprotein translocase subunit SecG